MEATRAAVAENVDRRLTELRALRSAAERQEAVAVERLERVRRDYLDRKLDADDWRAFREDLTAERDAAAAEAARLSAQTDREAEAGALTDAESEMLHHLADVRAAVLGDVQSAEGVEAVRAALTRLFDHFTLRPLPAVDDYGSEAGLNVERRYFLDPEVRRDSLDGIDADLWPVLQRQPLELPAATKEPTRSNLGRGRRAAERDIVVAWRPQRSAPTAPDGSSSERIPAAARRGTAHGASAAGASSGGLV